jgi:thiamine biosynthesis lipoprotein
MTVRPKLLTWAVPLLLLSILVGCTESEPVVSARFLAFGTLIDISIAGVPQDKADDAIAAIEQDFAEMHKAWHAWDPGPLGQTNRLLASGDSFTASPLVLPLIRLGKELSLASNRLFNPAIGHLIDAWGFHRDDPAGQQPPSQEEIDRLLEQNPQMDDISMDGDELRCSNPAVKLDFGAFGKGYGIDLAIQHLRELGIDNAILNAGGDLRAIGRRGDRPWRIAIRSADGKGVVGSIEVDGDESVFTSGDYERNFTWEGKRYHHIIDPRSGYPATGTASITVIHGDAVTADAAATALFIAGPEKWYEVAQSMQIGYVLLIDSEGTLHMNPAMQRRLQLVENNHQVKISPPLDAGAKLQ